MRAVKVSKEAPSNRMFESDFFEFFSHIHPWQPPVIYVPLIAYVCYLGIEAGNGWGAFAALFSFGLLTWTLLEYTLHRFLFHFHPSSALGKRMIWLLHGVHHDWPNDKLRLVFPPTLSLPLAALFFALFSATLGDVARFPAFAGLASGYLAYDMIHYYVHHFAPKNRVAKYLRRYHLAHHFKNPDSGYGVSSPLWDFVLGSRPQKLGE